MIWRQAAQTATIDFYGESNIGPVRPVNADAFLAAPVSQLPDMPARHDRIRDSAASEPHLFAVADGIGQESGRIASQIAIETMRHAFARGHHLFHHEPGGRPGEPLDLLKAAVRNAQERIHDETAHGNELHHPGTTLTLACVIWPRLYIAHVGDSRCYLFRDGRLRQLTTDHTFAQRLIDSGILTAEQARVSQWRHVLWNVVGGGTSDLVIDEDETDLLAGDRLLLCSDGLTGAVPDDEISRILREEDSPAECCRRFLDGADAAGATDNVTVLVACLSC